jgi:hypothetical protein
MSVDVPSEHDLQVRRGLERVAVLHAVHQMRATARFAAMIEERIEEKMRMRERLTAWAAPLKAQLSAAWIDFLRSNHPGLHIGEKR